MSLKNLNFSTFYEISGKSRDVTYVVEEARVVLVDVHIGLVGHCGLLGRLLGVNIELLIVVLVRWLRVILDRA